MVRWLGVLCVLTLGSALLALGVIPSDAAGLARILLTAYSIMLAATVVVGLLRR